MHVGVCPPSPASNRYVRAMLKLYIAKELPPPSSSQARS